MRIINNRLTVVLMVSIIMASLLAPAVAPSATAQEPESADDYFNTLRGMSDLEIYSEYSELETLHTQSLTGVQVGEFTDEQARELDAVIATIRQFEEAQAQFEDEEYEAGFETAADIQRSISELETHDESLAALSRLALTRYYEQLGSELASRAEETDNTPTEIELRELAAEAYRGANQPEQAAEFTRQVEQLRAELSADREQMDDAEAAVGSLTESCSNCESSTSAISEHNIGVIKRYQPALQTSSMITDAVQRANRHGLSDRQASLEAQANTAKSIRLSIAIASTTILVGYGLILGLLVAIITSRLFAWQRTFEAANVDSVVAVGDGDV